MTKPTKLLTPEEVAERIGLGRTKVYELLRRGDLASLTIGRARRIPEREVEAFIQRRLDAGSDWYGRDVAA